MADKDAPAGPVSVVQAMQQVMELVTVVRKDQVNTTPGQGGYKFRGIDAVVNAIGPAMRQVGLVVIPGELLDVQQKEIVVGQKQSRMIHSVVRVRYRVLGPAGDELAGESIGEAFDSGDKSMAKAMSVSLRTFLLQAFMLPTDDPDPDETSYDLGDAQRQELPPSRGQADRSMGRQRDAFAVNELPASYQHKLGDLLRSDDEDALRSAYYEAKGMQEGGTVYHVRPGTDMTKAEAGVLNITGPYLDLLEVVARISKHFRDEGCSVRQDVLLNAAAGVKDPGNQPTPMGSGDAEAARDAADPVRRPDDSKVRELRQAARGRNGGQQG